MAQDNQTTAKNQQAQVAPANGDSGTAKYDTYVVQANDALSHYATNLWRRNPELQEKFPELANGKIPLWGKNGVIKYLVDFNNNLPPSERPKGWQKIDTKGDVNCDGVKGRSPHVNAGQLFVYPELANEIDNPSKPCAKITEIPKEEQTVVPPPPAPAPSITVAPEKTPLLYVPSITSKEAYGHAISVRGFFQPFPPQRSRAVGNEDAGKMKDGALLPAYSQGAKVKVNGKEVEDGTAIGAKGTTYANRARITELTDRDAAEHTFDAQGNVTGYNKRFHRKAEYTPVKVVDGDGNVFNTPVGSALISAPAFNNPTTRHQTSDHDTANLRRDKHNYSEEDLLVTGYYADTQSRYEVLAGRLAAAETPEAAKDLADALLAANTKLAINPLTWSVDSRGVAVKSFDTIRSEMNAVLASPLLAEADKAALEAKYGPSRDALGDPDKQWAELQKIGGLEGTRNIVRESVREQVSRTDEINGRPVGKYLIEGYWDGLGREEGRKYSKDEKFEMTVAAGEALALKYERVGVRVPDHEIERTILLRDQDILNSERQKASPMEAARSAGLATIRDNPALMDDYISYSLENPGVLQAVSNRVYLSTMGAAKGNKATLDFARDSEADRFANEFVDQLAGKEFKGNLNYNGGIPVLKDVVNQVSFGLLQPWAKVNQDKGGYKFQQAALERWRNGTDEDRAQIREAFGEVFDRAESAAGKGVHDANADLVAVLDLRTAAYLNGGRAPETHQRIQAATGTLIRDNLVQRENGLAQLGASAELNMEKRRLNGEVYNTSIDTSAIAAAAASGDVKALGEAFRANNNPGLVTQGDTDRNLSLVTQSATPLGFSMVTLNAALDPATAKKFDGYLNAIDNGDKNMSNYADLMKQHLKAYRAAAGDPAALQAAAAAAESDLTAYFAQPNPNTNKGSVRMPINTASRYLAEHLAKDSVAAESFSAAFKAQVDGASSSMTAQEKVLLGAKLAVAGSPEAQGAIIADFTNASVNGAPITAVDPNASVNASVVASAPARQIVSGPALSDTQIAQIADLAGKPSTDTQAVNAQIAAIVGNAVPTPENQAALSALLNDTGATPEQQAAMVAGVNASVTSRQAALDAATNAAVNAGGTNPNASVNAGGTNPNASVNAGDTNPNASVNAGGTNPNASVNAGGTEPNASINAGGTNPNAPINAGGTNPNAPINAGGINPNAPINAGLVSAIASLNSGTSAETNAGIPDIIAGTPNVAMNAHGGPSWVATLINIIPFIPVNPPGNPLIPELPGIPGCPGCPRPTPGGGGTPGLPG